MAVSDNKKFINLLSETIKDVQTTLRLLPDINFESDNDRGITINSFQILLFHSLLTKNITNKLNLDINISYSTKTNYTVIYIVDESENESLVIRIKYIKILNLNLWVNKQHINGINHKRILNDAISNMNFNDILNITLNKNSPPTMKDRSIGFILYEGTKEAKNHAEILGYDNDMKINYVLILGIGSKIFSSEFFLHHKY